MKTTLPFFTLLLYASFSYSQIGSSTILTWMKGDNTIEQPGVYGIRGLADTSNKPGARDFSATWRDAAGDLWLFGGYGNDRNNNAGFLNDLWKYNPATNVWTWVAGDSLIGQPGVYGQQGIPHDLNKPCASYSSASWTDADGNLWLFGGFGDAGAGPGFLNHLWKYTPSTNRWTWIKGDNVVDETGRYGSRGTPHNNNKPGGRYGSRTWVDNAGKLWLFGGYGYDTENNGVLNDLWKFDPSTNKWVWVNGDNLVDQYGVYGSMGTGSVSNKPGGRYVSISWTDTNGDFWLFGGYGNTASSQGHMNDLWKYHPPTNQWTWIKGDSTIDQLGVYGTKGVVNNSNKPGGRYVSVSWTDSANNLWLFGGFGQDQATSGYLNDLWKYDPTANTWVWVKGDNTVDQPGVYGTRGMPTIFNKSGARTSSVSWTDGNGHLWFFGGFGFDATHSGLLNDMWKISTFHVLPIQLLRFDGVMNNDAVEINWQSQQEIEFSHFTVQRSLNGTDFSSLGQVNGAGGTQMNTYTYTDATLQGKEFQTAYYRLLMTDIDGSHTYSKTIRFNKNESPGNFRIYPNPVTTSVSLSFYLPSESTVAISVTDLKGQVVFSDSHKILAGHASLNIDVNALPASTYIISLRTPTTILHQKMVKQ
ncbi:MAG: T9SS type A sorting domain-containing protein [Chitinophagaceae bacterium]|nr:T9SS type A sorting domain-containing protein [Chitinophagaceae bacterium]